MYVCFNPTQEMAELKQSGVQSFSPTKVQYFSSTAFCVYQKKTPPLEQRKCRTPFFPNSGTNHAAAALRSYHTPNPQMWTTPLSDVKKLVSVKEASFQIHSLCSISLSQKQSIKFNCPAQALPDSGRCPAHDSRYRHWSRWVRADWKRENNRSASPRSAL